MKFLVLVFLAVVAAVSAEAPVLNQGYSSVAYQRFQQLPSAEYKAQFAVPARLELPPVFLVKQNPGAKGATTETAEVSTEQPRSFQTTTEFESERINNKTQSNEKEEINEENSFVEQGVYYIYHPDGLLQRVVFSTRNDVQDMGYTAQLKYKDVEPIKDPIYTYDPETLLLKQIQV